MPTTSPRTPGSGSQTHPPNLAAVLPSPLLPYSELSGKCCASRARSKSHRQTE
ncbi:hypothetical protein EV363DRAFT_1276292 [Boletus edulis]|nr:hypothetical protein EV363DRAFT_1276292 [Boletus edulis]